jgi:SsrA-binding protein
MRCIPQETRKTVSTNRKARFEYELFETYEAGLVLEGPEVMSLRRGTANLEDAWIGFSGSGKPLLMNTHIPPYPQANRYNADPTRPRPLLLHDWQLLRLKQRVREKGLTLVPTQLYFEGRWCKLEFAVARGKKLHDKRASSREAEDRREIQRALRRG